MSHFLVSGRKVFLPEGDEAAGAGSAPAPAPLTADPALAAQLEPFGFSANAVTRALLAVQNSSVEGEASVSVWVVVRLLSGLVTRPRPSDISSSLCLRPCRD